jgi:hypothetical protein
MTSHPHKFVSLILVAALSASAFAPVRTLQSVSERHYINQRGVLHRSRSISGARPSLDIVARNDRDRQQRHREQTVTSNGVFSAKATHHLTLSPVAEFIPCNLYPIALSANSLSGIAPGESSLTSTTAHSRATSAGLAGPAARASRLWSQV